MSYWQKNELWKTKNLQAELDNILENDPLELLGDNEMNEIEKTVRKWISRSKAEARRKCKELGEPYVTAFNKVTHNNNKEL